MLRQSAIIVQARLEVDVPESHEMFAHIKTAYATPRGVTTGCNNELHLTETTHIL